MKKMIILSFVILLLFTSHSHAKDPHVVIVTGNAEYPPICWRDRQNPERLIGASVELVEHAFKGMNIIVSSRYVGLWKRAQSEIRNGRVDILCGAYVTEERKIYMDYIDPPFMMDPTVIFVKKGSTFRFESWNDLVGYRGGSPTGNSYGEKFDRFAAEKLNIVYVPEIFQAFKKLVNDRSDYIVYGLYPGLSEAIASGFNTKIDYLKNSVISEGLHYTISKKSEYNTPEVKNHLKNKLIEYQKIGFVDDLLKKYMDIWKEQSAK